MSTSTSTTGRTGASGAAGAAGAWDIRGRSALRPPVRPPAEAVALRAARPHDDSDVSSLDFWRLPMRERDRTLADLRRRAPVSWQRPFEMPLVDDPDDHGFWAVASHAALVEATRRHHDFISGEGVVPDSIPQELLDSAQGFIAMDPPQHTKVRRLLASAFTPRQMARVEDRIRANAARVVDEMLAHDGGCDFVSVVAGPTPMHNVFDLVGLADGPRRHELAAHATTASGWRDPAVNRGVEPLVLLGTAAWRFRETALELVAARREDPRDDLMTALVRAEVDGDRLNDDEIASFFGLLAVAGTDTTRQSLAHAVIALSEHPDQRAWLLEDLEGRMPTAVEEVVRWATPIMTFRRTCATDVELQGVAMTQGDKVVLLYPSANRDEAVFRDPWSFDLSRSPNPHVSFGGGGIHTCLGNVLARRQVAALLTELLTRAPDVRVDGEPSLTLANFFHQVNHLPVRW